jgi:tRNA-splicing ligase RtcB
MLLQGAEYVSERWGCDPTVLNNIENRGSMFDEEDTPASVTDIVPFWLLRYSGTYENTPIPGLAGNHFIEFQVVDEIIDEETATEWGLSEGQIVISLHGDYTLTSMINWHHSNRLKFRERVPFLDRTKLQLSKATFHLIRGGVRNFRNNWQLYDSKNRYTRFDASSAEGKHLSKAIYAAMNFGYANRLLAALCIEESLSEASSATGEVELLWDVGHDTIQEETIDGSEYWVHRKGAAKAVPGKPALVSGSYNMNSFLGKSEPTADAFVYSYDHGCSNVIEHFASEEGLRSVSRSTMRFDLKEGAMTGESQHVEPLPIETLVQNLTENDIVSEVAWLQPIANIGE